jgi:hypothetical protein
MLAMSLACMVALLVLGGLRDRTLALQRAVARQRELAQADALLTAMSLWPSEELERRLGSRRQGPFVVTIATRARGQFEIAIVDASSGSSLLHTRLLRSGAGR